jgi:hypothetical protein
MGLVVVSSRLLLVVCGSYRSLDMGVCSSGLNCKDKFVITVCGFLNGTGGNPLYLKKIDQAHLAVRSNA